MLLKPIWNIKMQSLPHNRFDNIDFDQNSCILLRCDFNVPLDQEANISDDTRIQLHIESIQYFLKRSKKIIIIAHMGRPKGKFVKSLSLKPIQTYLREYFKMEVGFYNIFQNEDNLVQSCKEKIVLLENLRFDAGEEDNDLGLAKRLAKLGDYYVNDAFSVSHRAHASTHAIANLLPAYAGPAMCKELSSLTDLLTTPKRALMSIVGGAKISSKLHLLHHLIEKVDVLVIAGGMANTFLAAQNINIGKSLVEENLIEEAMVILQKAKRYNKKLILPQDVVVSSSPSDGKNARLCKLDAIACDDMIFDVGSQTVATIIDEMSRTKTVVWNGPLGMFEVKPFDQATILTMRFAAKQSVDKKLLSVAGGGDTLAALSHAGVAEQFNYISSAGGAFLEWLEGRELPGVAILQ